MPSISTRWLYPICVLLAILVYFLTASIAYPHPDSSYLNARYARNLVEGEGFVYNPDEKILLTWSPLVVLTHAAISLPSGEVNHPPELLVFVLMGMGVTAMIRIFSRAALPIYWGICVALIWLIFLAANGVFGGVDVWLAVFALLALDLAQSKYWQLAAIVTGLMLLISPLAVCFVLLFGIIALRENAPYWRWVMWPALVWYGFAFWYFGADGLRGLTLISTAETPISPLIGMIYGGALLFWLSRSFNSQWAALIIFGAFYGVCALMVEQQSFALLSLGCVLAAVATLQTYPTKTLQISTAVIGIFLFGLLFIQPDSQSSTDELESMDAESLGGWGSSQQAFAFADSYYQLAGQSNPHLNELSHYAPFQDVLIATAPDILLPENANFTLPTDPPTQLLNYTQDGNIWRRNSTVGTWQEPKTVHLDFGPDLLLKSVTQDKSKVEAGSLLRLRLDWAIEGDDYPYLDILFLFQVLNQQQAVFGAIEQTYPYQRFERSQITTYHVVPVNADALPGWYEILLIVNYNGGDLARLPIANFKIPAPTDIEFNEPPMANFNHQAELMQAEIEQSPENLQVNLTWRAQAKFEAAYIVFVHLTPADDIQPVSQGDAPPAYGTTLWEKGEVIQDAHVIPLENVPAGDYVLRVGFFHPDLGRIPTDTGDSVIVGTVTIK